MQIAKHILCAGLLTVLLALSACQNEEQVPDVPSGGERLESTDDFATTDDLIADRSTLPGAALYAENCASCHNGQIAKAPHFNWLEMMPPARIVNALERGVMTAQGSALTGEEHLQVAEYITRQPVSGGLPPEPAAPLCTDQAAVFDASATPAPVNWGHDAKRYVPQAVAQLTGADVASLSLKWAYAFPNATRARSQPSIGYGALYVGSEDGSVYAFDLETGCQHWRFRASAEVRTAVVLSTEPNGKPMLFFGDIIANFYALDALTGDLIWRQKMDDHPNATLTGSPLLKDGALYVPVSSLEIISAASPDYACCTFRGSIAKLDAATGKEIWRFYPIAEAPSPVGTTAVGTDILGPSGAPVWTSPTFDEKRGLLYFGTGENYSSPADANSDAIFAIDAQTGARVWQRQTVSGDAWNVACMMADNPNCPAEDGPDFDHSASMLLVDLPGGDQVLVAGHKNGTVFGLDPDEQGKLLWQTKVGRGSIQGGVHFGLAAAGHVVYVPINDMNKTRNGDVLDPAKARPGINAVDARDGTVLWSHVQENVCGPGREFCDPGISAAVTAIDGAVIAGHLDGYVRAYGAKDGDLLWQFNTAREMETVNDAPGKGGGMSGPGAAVGEGYVAINSGYGLYYHEPGNLLLVFKGKT